MATLESKLILSMVNRVTGPARAVQADMRRVRETAGRMGRSIGRVVTAAGAAAAAAAGATFALAKSASDTGDRVAKQAAVFGITAEKLQELEFAAERAGIGAKQFSSNMTALTKRMGEGVQRGTGPAVDAMEALGLNIDEVAQLPVDAQLGIIADRMEGIDSATERAAISAQLFSRSGVDMSNMLGNGSGELDERAQEARDLNRVMSNEAAGAGEAFADAMTNVQSAIEGVKQAIGVELMPVFTDLMDRMAEFVSSNPEKIREFAETFAQGVEDMVAKIPAFLESLRSIGESIRDVAVEVKDMVGGWQNFAIVIGALLTRKLIFDIGSFAFAVGRLAASSATLAAVKLGTFASNITTIAGATGISRVSLAMSGLARVTGLTAVASGIGAVAGVIAAISAPVWIGIAAAIAAVGAAWKFWDRIVAIVSGVGSAVIEEIQPLIDWVGEQLEPLEFILAPIGGWFSSMTQGIRDAVSGIREFLSGGIFQREKLTDGEFASVEAEARKAAKAIIDFFKDTFNDFIEWVGGIPGRIIDAIGSVDLGNVITWTEPAWLREAKRFFGLGDTQADTPAAPDISAQAAQAGQTPVQRATQIVESTPLPAVADVQQARSEAERLRAEIAAIQQEIRNTPRVPGSGQQIERLRDDMQPLQAQLADVDGNLATMHQSTLDVQEAVRILGDADVSPTIDDTSIRRAREQLERIERTLGRIDTGARVGTSGPIDGARAGGGPVQRGRTYMTGEEGPELFTPQRSGFIHTARETAAMAARASAIGASIASPVAALPGAASVAQIPSITIPQPTALPVPQAAPSPTLSIATQEIPAQATTQAQAGPTNITVNADVTIQGGANASAEELGQEFGRQVAAKMRSQFSDEF